MNLLRKLLTMTQHYHLPLLSAGLVCIALLSLTPLPALPAVPGSDKTHHFIAYAALALPLGLRRPRRWWLLAGGLAAASGAIELIQPYVNRYGEWLDLLANCSGLLIGLALGTLLRHYFLSPPR
ncbi:MAG: hypothetical protein ACRCYV_10295 [Aeromonas sp.]